MANKTSLTQGIEKSLDGRKGLGFLLEYSLFVDQDIYFVHDFSPFFDVCCFTEIRKARPDINVSLSGFRPSWFCLDVGESVL